MSPPKLLNSSLTITKAMGAVLTTAFAVSSLGCSALSINKSSREGYEEAKRSVESSGVFRPEGVTAERNYSAAGFLDRVGIAAKKRRNIEVARSHYGRADELFEEAKSAEGADRAKLFRKAADQYKLAASNWQSSGLEQDALVMAAEAHFFAEDYYQAERLYSGLVKEYPRNPYLDHVDSRRFEIADFWLKHQSANKTPSLFVNFTDNKLPWNDAGGHGKRVLENVRIDNPTGKVGDDATMRLAMEYYENHRYEDAADTFADVRMSYPDSEHQFNAQLLELQSLLASYQGPDYSSVPITEAQSRLEQLAKQFPQQMNEHEEELQAAYAKARFAMAERIWNQADYRRKRGEYGAAKFYYERILEEYGDTPFGDRAREQLQKLADKPNKPPQRLGLLVWALGGTSDKRPYQEWLEEQKTGQPVDAVQADVDVR